MFSLWVDTAQAQSLPITGSPVSELAAVDQIIINWLEGKQFQAATLAVVKDRRLVYSRGYGWQDASRSVPISPDAVMRLASNSKPVTAAAIRLLATRGQLSLNAKVYDLLQIPPSGALGNQHHQQYTVEQVLNHVAGLAGGAPGTGELGRMLGLGRAATLEDAVAYMWTRPLGATPGTYSYSNWGYQLLGAVIEKVSGMSYDQYVKTQVMMPIHASTFAVGTSTGGSPNEIWYQAVGSYRPEWDYNFTLPSVPAAYAIDMEARPAAGSLISSAPDYSRFLNAYYHTGTAKPVSFTGIGWGYEFHGSLPGTWTISNEHISAAKGQIVYVILLNQRIEGDSTSLSQLSTNVRNFLHGIVTWPDHDFFVSPEGRPVTGKPVINPVTMPVWQVGQPAPDFTITVTNGATKIKVTGLPPGVKFDPKTGQFTGRPTKAKMVKKVVVPYTVTITATNDAGTSEPYTFEWLVEPLSESVLGSFYGTVDRDENLNGRTNLDQGFGGFVQAKVASSGAVSGSIRMAGINLPFRGGMEPQSDGSLEFSTQLKRKKPLDPLDLSLVIANDGTLSGFVTDGASTAELDGWKMHANPERAGIYNVALEPGGSSHLRPSGSGFGVLKVSAKGTATIKGKLADGTAMTGSSAVAANGKFPWHQMLYKNTGSVQGVLTFGANSITGNADWNKAAQAKTSPNYMDGFTLHGLAVSGGRYVKPGKGEAALGLPSALLVRLADGGLEDPYLWLPVTLTDKNTLVAAAESAGLKIKLAYATGLITGTFMVADLEGGKPRKMVIAGALIPGEAAGMGHFLLPSSSAKGAPVLSGQVVLDSE